MVTVIMSTYNDASFLSPSIKSVLNQTYEDFEFIIVNDGSTDNTEKILNFYSEVDPRIKIIHKPNTGLTKSLNLALSVSNGKYIARIDSDDIWLPNKLSLQVKFLDKNPSYALLGTSYIEIGENGEIIFEKQRVKFLKTHEDILNNIHRFNPFLHSSVLLRRSILDKIGFYNESFRYSQDYEFWVRIISNARVCNLNKILVKKRYQEQMISVINEKCQKRDALKAKIFAIRILNKSIGTYRFLLKDLLAIILPKSLLTVIRKL